MKFEMNACTKFVDWLLEMGYMTKEDITEDAVDLARDIGAVRRHAPKLFNMLMCMCNCEDRAYDDRDRISKVDAIVTDIMELLPKKADKIDDDRYWCDGEEILVPTEVEADVIADFFDELYDEGTVNTGYYDPFEDAKNHETDEYTGWHYVNFVNSHI